MDFTAVMQERNMLSVSRAAAIARNDMRLVRREPTFLIIMVVMPLVVMAFVKDAFRPTLVTAGIKSANGAEQAVPGMAVMFAFFLMGNVGFGIFQEHGWGTWQRLRASRATASEILGAKTVTPFVASVVQLAILFLLGGLVFSLRIRGSWVGLILVSLSLSACLVALGLALAGVCRSIVQLNAIATVGALTLAGLGGAITPIESLPHWAKSIAPATPTYWAMRGYRAVIIRPGSLSSVMTSVLMLLAFAATFGVIALARFRVDDQKMG
jgi:ABC-2 type transport system permease protein